MARALDRGTIPFQTAGRLLQELGERLVASAEVALVELVKNSYDADSPDCLVSINRNGTTLIVEDHGAGMTLDEFIHRWMTIATSHKLRGSLSPKYGRRVTGQKGIGRFAVRFLGRRLKLETVAVDHERGHRTRLVADFDWAKIDLAKSIADAAVPYRLYRTSDSAPTGTKLTIRALKKGEAFAKSSEFRTQVLKIVSPIEGLDGGRFGRAAQSKPRDPGFQVSLPQDKARAGKDEMDPAKTVLSHAWARLEVNLSAKGLTYSVRFNDGSKVRRLKLKKATSIGKGLVADIRFFPRRAGIFRGREVDGKEAWKWVRRNCGVAVVDHGFRIKPYGFEDNDWLMLDSDLARNRRVWRSKIAKGRFPVPKAQELAPAINPVLNLPSNFQLVGAVFLESRPPSGTKKGTDLTPSMDREGFLKNEAFDDLVEIVRAGIEFLANEDKKRQLAEKERKAKEAAKQTRADLRAAVRYIQSSPTLTKADKTRLVEEYSGLAKRLDEVEEYDREARRKLETMSALGVVAGFMTHETTRLTATLEEAIATLRSLTRKHQQLSPHLHDIEKSYDAFCSYLDYTRTFVDAVQAGVATPFKARVQAERIGKKFGYFADERGIKIGYDIDKAVMAPRMPVPIYSGVLLNLFTNGLKALVAAEKSTGVPRIVFRGWNDQDWHVVEVLDTGIGVPPELRKRIWDPLFTTTSRLNNPLGSGMGLGLNLVKQLVEHVGGRLEIVDPPAGFSTCFRARYPRKAKK